MARPIFALILFGALVSTAEAFNEPAILVGVGRKGFPTSAWLDAIKARVSSDDFERIRSSKRPLTPEELAWLDLIREVAPSWEIKRESLLVPFGGIDQPRRVSILVGNQIGDDAFTAGEDTLCFDLAALARNYGDPKLDENRDRLIRFLDHEYTHLLHHAWLRNNPISLATPLDRALRDLIVEGLGNYRSLSSRWINQDGNLTEVAKTALNELEPTFVDRLARLRTATVADEAAITAGLSRGPFHKKWGALTIALWLANETKGDQSRLREWVVAGPKGVLRLAERNLQLGLRRTFAEAFQDHWIK